MRKFVLFLITLAILTFSLGCTAEEVSVGGGFGQNTDASSSAPLNSGIGGGLTPQSPASPDAAPANMRPSPEWLASIDTEQIADICALLNDPTYISLAGISERLVDQFNPADTYGAEPSLLIYAPRKVPTWLKLAMSTSDAMSAYADSPASICNLITSTIYSTMNSEDLARSASLILDSYYPVDAAFVPTVAFYTSADGSESDVLMISHIYDDGIMHISSRFISASAYNFITDKNSHIHMLCDTMNADILPVEGEFPEFFANIALPDGVEVPKTDDAWLCETAISLAREMIETRCSPEYAIMFTSNQAVMDICIDVGAFDIENAKVESVVRFDENLLASTYSIDTSSENYDLLQRYVTPKLASASTNLAASAHSAAYLAAQSICTGADTFFAEADFICCNATLTYGGPHKIVVSFSRYDDSIVNAVVHPIPAE